MKLTVLIPTYRRNDLLIHCIRSIFQSRFRPIDVIVSDDANDLTLASVIPGLSAPEGVVIDYVPGPAMSSQSANVNHLLELCDTELCILMHDDDFFLPAGIDRMIEAWRSADREPDAVFGRQQIVDESGRPLTVETKKNDARYFKDRPDICHDSRLASALVGQFPNNGMLMRTDLARTVRYPREDEVGRIPVDFHFSLRYALAGNANYVCLQDYTTAYRAAGESVIRSVRTTYDGHLGYEVLERLGVGTDTERWALDIARNRFSGAAVLGYLWHDDRRTAWKVLRDRFWTMDKPLPVRLGLILLVAASFVGIKPQSLGGLIGRARGLTLGQ